MSARNEETPKIEPARCFFKLCCIKGTFSLQRLLARSAKQKYGMIKSRPPLPGENHIGRTLVAAKR
jgi:hypothetical protein